MAVCNLQHIVVLQQQQQQQQQSSHMHAHPRVFPALSATDAIPSAYL
jgi:hypothetical protein